MIRIIYKWKVQKSGREKFKTAWAKATTKIRASTAGARGSMMLHNREKPSEFVTIARWDSFESWQRFWNDPLKNEMQAMHEAGERVSVDAFDEIDDFTV